MSGTLISRQLNLCLFDSELPLQEHSTCGDGDMLLLKLEFCKYIESVCVLFDVLVMQEEGTGTGARRRRRRRATPG